MAKILVETATGEDLAAPLELLEEHLRDGKPSSDAFLEQLQDAVSAGNIEVLAAHVDGDTIGVAVISYRPSVSLGGTFASIEDLYVRPDARRQSVGRSLLDAVEERCAACGISYVEVQVESDEATAFYSAVGYDREPGVRVFSRSYALRPVGKRQNLKPVT